MTVSAPAGMTVYVGGKRIPLQDGRLTFPVPSVHLGERYVYQFRAETPRAGDVRVEQRSVVFRGGEKVHVDFTRPESTSVTRK